MFLKDYLSSDITRIHNVELDNLTLAVIPIDKIKITQSQKQSFSIEHLQDILKEFHPAIARAPSVAFINDEYILWDGQHTALAFYLNGMDNIPCLVYKTNNLSFIGTTCVEKFDRNQLVHLIYDFMLDNNCNTINDVDMLLEEFNKTI